MYSKFQSSKENYIKKSVIEFDFSNAPDLYRIDLQLTYEKLFFLWQILFYCTYLQRDFVVKTHIILVVYL